MPKIMDTKQEKVREERFAKMAKDTYANLLKLEDYYYGREDQENETTWAGHLVVKEYKRLYL